MAIADLFRALRARETTQLASVKARYLEMVAAAARDKSVDADEAAELLRAVSKTAVEFEADVRSAKNRIELRLRIERARGARPKLKGLESRANDIEAAFVAAQARFAAEVDALHAESAPLQAIISLAAGAEATLLDTCPDAGLLGKYKAVSREWTEANERVQCAKAELDEDKLRYDGRRLEAKLKSAIKDERREARTGWEDRVRGMEDILADPERWLRGKRQPKLDDAEADAERLDARRVTLELAILEA